MKLSSCSFAIKIFFCAVLSIYGQETGAQDFLNPPDSMITEGIPKISKNEVNNIFYNPAELSNSIIWDTDKDNRKLFVTSETNDVYLLESAMSKPIKLMDQITPYSLKVRPESKSFAYTFDPGKNDSYQLHLFSLETKLQKQLTNITSKDQSIDSFTWSQSGKLIFYTNVDYKNKVTELCSHNLEVENCYKINLEGNWNVLDASEDNVLLKYWKSAGNQWLYYFNVKTEKLTPVSEIGNNKKGVMLSETVLWISEGDPLCQQERCILAFDIQKNQKKKLNLPGNLINITDLKISPNEKRILIQESIEGIDKLRVFNLKKDEVVREIPQFVSGSYVIWNTRWLSDDEIAYTRETVGKPVSIHSYNINSNSSTEWIREKLPQHLSNKITATELIEWKSFDQKKISGFLVRPESSDKKKFPVLINVHGGPQSVDKPVFNQQDIAVAANLGMAIIHTNIRGSSGFTTEFMDADNQEKRGDAIKDIQSLLDWIEKQPELDSSQIYLRGWSYGGFVVLSAGLQEPKRIKGIIAEYPIVSIRGYLSQNMTGEFAIAEYGNPKDEALMTKLDALSPLNNTKYWNKIPVLLTFGKRDARIPEKDVVDLKTQLQKQDSPVWYILSNDSGHGVGGDYVFATIFKFLKTQINQGATK